MPELPEVETVRAGLAPLLEGQMIRRVELRRDGLRYPFPPNMAARLTGRTITRLGRRAKYLLIELDDQHCWVVHLGMTGRLLYHAHALPPLQTHDHVLVDMAPSSHLVFNDARRFGAMELVAKADQASHPWFAHLGPEPLDEKAFTPSYLLGRARGRKQPVKPWLMDQRTVVGVGNIYASEALFRAGIHPRRPASSLSEEESKNLVQAIQEVLHEALASGGSTLRDFVRSSGDAGYFQHAFRVYGRAGTPCSACGCVIERLVQAGRSGFFCSSCQPMV